MSVKLSRMKPLPKFILLTACIVGAVFLARALVLSFPSFLPSQKTESKAEPVVTTTVPAEGTQIKETPTPTPSSVEALKPTAPADAGLANVLGTNKKQ